MAAEIGSSTTAYLRGNGLVYSKTGATGYYYRRNAHGDVYQKLNTSGSVAKTYKYDAFGNEVSPDANDTNPWRYCGEYFDKESGTVYLRARCYSPIVGRFTAEDTHWDSGNAVYGDNPGDNPTPSIAAINQSGNLYVYSMNSPLMYRDSNGQWVHLIAGALIGGLIGGAIDLGTQLLTTGEVNWGSVGASAAAGAVTGTMAAATGGISLTATAAVASGALIGGTGYLTYNMVNSSEATGSGFSINGIWRAYCWCG